MRYMLSMWGGGAASTPAPGPEWMRGMLAAMDDLDARLRGSGELVHDEGFDDPALAMTVFEDGTRLSGRVGRGDPLIGFWIVDVDSLDRAAQIAAEIAHWSGSVEVRPVGSKPELPDPGGAPDDAGPDDGEPDDDGPREPDSAD